MCLYEDNPNYLVQVGIKSWDIECGLSDSPTIYVKVTNFVHWIQEEIKNNV